MAFIPLDANRQPLSLAYYVGDSIPLRFSLGYDPARPFAIQTGDTFSFVVSDGSATLWNYSTANAGITVFNAAAGLIEVFPAVEDTAQLQAGRGYEVVLTGTLASGDRLTFAKGELVALG